MGGQEMKYLRWGVKAAWWLLAGPFLAARWLSRLIGRLAGGWVLATRDQLPCPGCGEPVSLVGRWQCEWCQWVFDGFAFSRCEICGAVPPFIECQRCGAGVRNPAFFP